ncbi:MAG: SHOCT domain-containing protein [Phycisphaerales bacterium]|jgi:uncharacterized membrane protein|nr:SHOCT domain-containing protein [Phycisphaerales bacterium]
MIVLGSVLTEILPATILLIVLVILGGIFILRARKMLKSSSETTLPFTLEELRKLHAKGELTDEEFERAKVSMVEKTKNQ